MQTKNTISDTAIVYCIAYLEQNRRPKLKRRMGGLPRTEISGGDMNGTNKNWILEMMTLKPTRSARASNQESGAQTLGNIGENEGGGELTCAKEEDDVGRDSRAGGAAAH